MLDIEKSASSKRISLKEDVSDPPDFQFAIEEAIHAIRGGDASELGLLVDIYRPYLLKLAASQLDGNIAIKFAPSDAVQETMLQATRDFPQFRGATETELRQWLQTILLRTLADVHRRYRLSKKRKLSLEVRVHSGNRSSLKTQLTSREPSPSAGLRREESTVELQQAISRLSEEHQSVIRLRNFERLSFDDIGKRLIRTSEAARKLWCRAIERLTEELESDHAEST